MTTREVVLDGGSPWGFRLHGGADVNQPLRISRVNPGSKAALRGIREGDFITSINNQSTKDISNAEAHALLRNSGDTLKLGLNEDVNGSPKRRQYKTVHQETHSETVKKSSVTSYTVTSSKTVETANDQQTAKVNGNANNGVNGDPPTHPIASQRSTLSSNCSSSSSTSTYTSLTSPSDMADNGRRRRRRNNRKKARQVISTTEVIVEEIGECDVQEKEYQVESPKRVKSPEKKPIKSRSLDDDDDVKIQELSEVSESEDKSECKAIISEAESDVEWETAATIDELEPQTSTLTSTNALYLPLEQCTTQQVSLISPEEELTLRNFLEGLNLVNSPEDAFKQIQLSTIDSVKSRRARKRAVLEQYFSPMVHNPRFLDVISEEASDLSDREQPATRHLKQGTPEPEVPVRPPKKRNVVENPAILVGTRIIDIPMVSTVVPQARAEVVFLEDSSNSTTPDPKSDDEEKDTDDVISSANSSAPDLRESEVVEETKKVKVTVKKSGVLVCMDENLGKEILSELTPPPTPDNSENIEATKLDETKEKAQLTKTEDSEVKCAKDEIIDVENKQDPKVAQDTAQKLDTTIFSADSESEVSKVRVVEVKLDSDSKSAQKKDDAMIFKKSQEIDSVEESKKSEISKENRESRAEKTSMKLEESKERIIPVTLESETKPVRESDKVSKDSPKSPSIEESIQQGHAKKRIIEVKLESASSFSTPIEKIIEMNIEDNSRFIQKKKDEYVTSKESSQSTHVPKERIIDVKLEGDSKSSQTKNEGFVSKNSSKPINISNEKIIDIKLEEDATSNQAKSSKGTDVSKERIIDIKVEKDSTSTQVKKEDFISEKSSKTTNVSKERIIDVKFEGDSKPSQVKDEDFISKESSKVSDVSKERIIDVKLEGDSTSIQAKKEDFISEKSSKTTNVSKERIIDVKFEGDSTSSQSEEKSFNITNISKERIIDVEILGDSKSNQVKNEGIISKDKDASKERIIDVKLEGDSKSSQTKNEDLISKESSPNANVSKERVIDIKIEDDSKLVHKENEDFVVKKSSKNDSGEESEKSEISKETVIKIKLEKPHEDVISKDSSNNLSAKELSKNSGTAKERLIEINLENGAKLPQKKQENKNENTKEKIIKIRLEGDPVLKKAIFGKSHSLDEYKTSEKILEARVERDSRFSQNLDFPGKDIWKKPHLAKEKIIDFEREQESKYIRHENRTFSHQDLYRRTENKVGNSNIPIPEKSKERIIEVKVEKEDTSTENLANISTCNIGEFNTQNRVRKDLEVKIESDPKSVKNVEIIRTPDLKSSPEIIKLDDLTPPVVLVPSGKPVTRNIPVEVETPSRLKDLLEDLEPKSTSRLKSILQEESKPKQESPSKQITIKLTESPSKEVESICSVQVPESLFYTNVLSPPVPSPSPSLSSGSSRATSLCTAKYNPMNSSIADITSIKDDDSFKGGKAESPASLRQLCVDFLMSQPFGADVLQELADVSSSIEHLTSDLRQDLVHQEVISGGRRAVDRQVEISSIEPRLLAIIRDAQEPRVMKFSTLPRNMESARLKAKDLSEWLELARRKDESSDRRKSAGFYEQQMRFLQEKEREIQEELELLEEEKRQLEGPRRFREEDFMISKRGDFAESRKPRPVSMPVATEVFRRQMYDEYLDKMKEREERKQLKVLKVSQVDSAPAARAAAGIEDEFMDMVKQKQKLGKLNKNEEKTDDEEEKLPKHLQEFMEIAEASESDGGVWSPGQKQEPRPEEPRRSQSEVKNEPLSPVWTPKSATSSPTVERKEFRPVKFESPVLSRKSSRVEDGDSSDASKEPPWKVPETSSDTGVVLSSTLEKRLPTSHSSPACGFNDFPTTRLPKAQNPTITLLQKAREGQLPKGALYIEQDQTFKRPQNDRPPFVGPGEILYKIKNEYTSESDSEKARKMADLGARKYEGIGPTTKDGMPLILRSEVKDANQSKWYKKMYDTIHKQRPHRDEYVTVRYKQRRGQYPYTSGYLSEPEPGAYDSDFDYKYATLDRRRVTRDKENDYVSSTMPRSTEKVGSSVVKHGHDPYKNQPGRIENYIPGHSSISEKEAKEWWDEVMDIFDGWLDDNSALPSYDYMFSRALAKSHLEQQKRVPQTKSFINQALKESGYESDSTLVFRRRDDTAQQLSPSEQKEAYKTIQKGGDIPLYGLRKPAPERPKEPEPPLPPPKGQHGVRNLQPESPRKYVENEVTIHYKTPVRQEIKEYLSEDELAYRQAEAMKKIYQEERRRKYLQELQDMTNRRHTDNFIPSQKSPIPLNRYDDFDDLAPPVKPRPRSPEPRLMARALYNFVGQTARELTFRKGDLIYVRRQVDKNWYEGELNAMVGLFPVNYVEIVTYDAAKPTPRKSHEGQARAKYNFVAQTHLELSLAKGELVVITRRVDDNWFEGKIGGRKGIFPVSYVEVLIDPSDPPPPSSKPVAAPAAHSLLLNGSAGGKESMGSHSYTPSLSSNQLTSSYHAKPVQVTGYGSLNRGPKNPMSQALHIETQSEPIPYRALYKYLPQNDDELELFEGDTVYVLEKCDDGWYVGSSDRTGAFGTFPGNYVEKI
ncbi:uncharacterized protein LOC135125429 isoform X2 [Zophobas morio]|uniref:uncharacterized protein LOC135125429 isoform X2 n=1 Tax=Zophobas morio TaxID=2755281 RepID=UPI0030833F84